MTPTERRERDRLLAQVREVAEQLKMQFGVRQVILFGSLAHVAWFTRTSDIDLAVEGLRHQDYWQAWRAVEEAFPDRRVDLITLEIASESLKSAIARYGVEL
jgi:predicted nucleotidyltransferase